MTERAAWQRTSRQGNRMGLARFWSFSDKSTSGASANKPPIRIGSEAFWTASIDKESEKAARILRSYCRDGVYQDEIQTADGIKQTQKVIKKIPVEIIQNAKGLAIFTTMRAGLWHSGAGGSGIVVARLPNGSWSPPSAILLHTAGIGVSVGVDIYDCVLVLNTQQAVDAFAKWRLTLGGDMSAVAGPFGVEDVLQKELNTRQAPIYAYLRSRGFYATVQIDGTVVVERTEDNEKFYGSKYSASEILSGKVSGSSPDLSVLVETLKAAQGDSGVDERALPLEPPPSDFEVVQSDHVFGLPDKEDPDPFGVLALEKEGFQIKEAGSQSAASTEAFEFRPSYKSPIFDHFSHRRSTESASKRSSWRNSAFTMTSGAESPRARYVTMDTACQTDFPIDSPPTTPGLVEQPKEMTSEDNEPDKPTIEADGLQVPAIKQSTSSHEFFSRMVPVDSSNALGITHGSREVEADDQFEVQTLDHNTVKEDELEEDDLEDESYDDELDEEEPEIVIHQVQQAARPQSIIRPRLVVVSARPKPELPTRNPGRAARIRASLQSDEVRTSSDHGVNTSPALSERETLGSEENGHVRQNSSASTVQEQESVTSPESSPRGSPSMKSARSEIIDDKDDPEDMKSVNKAAVEDDPASDHNTTIAPPPLSNTAISHEPTAHLEETPLPGGFPKDESSSSPVDDDGFEEPPSLAEIDAGYDENRNPSAPMGPRISLMSVKMQLEEDEDDEGKSPSPQRRTLSYEDDFS